MSNKWTTVGGGKKGGHSTTTTATKSTSSKIGGLQESSSSFAQYSRLADEEEESQDVEGPTLRTSKRLATATTERKKAVTTKKPKIQKYNFDEFVRELDPSTLHNLTKEAHQKYPNHPQNLLKEVTVQVEQLFGDVEVEREFAFTNRTPGYPLATLSGPCQEPLLRVISSCPPLAQESIFRYCLDQLLIEVRTGLPSYGTRIILQLLIQIKLSTCTECTQKIKLLLQSSLSKVSEALSLLWAGLPHPKLHPLPALGVWSELCLPLLYSTPNVPRQVLNYAVDYTCNLLRVLEETKDHNLVSKLPPTTLCALLASPLLNTRRTQTNVQEMFHQLQTTLISSCSDKEMSKYFTAIFKRLTEDKLSLAAISFVMCCVSHSVSSVYSWCKLFPSLPFSSQLLLKELAREEQLSPESPLREIEITLSQIVARGSPEEKTLAQGLLSRHKALFKASQQKKQFVNRNLERAEMEGGWCSGCGFLLMLVSITYLVLLSLLLYQLAQNGPDAVTEYLPLRREWVDQSTSVMWRVLSTFLQCWDGLF